MRLVEQAVGLQHIDAHDSTYRITTRSGIEDLTVSIARVGLLHAPVLQPTGDRCKVVAGFRRIEACKDSGCSHIAAKLLPADATELQRTELAIADNSLQRPLSPVEIARSLALLSRCHADRGDLCAAAAALRLPDNADLVQKYLQLATLPPSLQDGVVDEVIALSMALALAEMEEPLAEQWIRIFRDLRVGLNRQRELLTLVAEIGAREDQTAADVLTDPSIRRILQPAGTDPAHKYRQLADCLRRRRYPHITRAERRFADLVRALQLGPDAQLLPPAHFEASAYQLRLMFRSSADLKKHLQTVEKLIENPAFEAIWE